GSSSAMGPFRAIRLWGRRKWSTRVVSAPGDATRSSVVSRPRSGSRYIKTTLAAVGAMAVLAALVGAWSAIHRSRAMAERQAAISDIERLVDNGRFVDVWRIAQPALRRWPNDQRLQQLQGATTMTVTIATDPSGADVAFKALDDVKGEWVPLGTSPLTGVR